MGNFLKVTSLRSGIFNNQVVLSSNRTTQFHIQEAPVEEVVGEVLCVDYIKDDNVFLLFEGEHAEELVTIRIRKDLLLSKLGNGITELTQTFPTNVTISKRGSEAIDIYQHI